MRSRFSAEVGTETDLFIVGRVGVEPVEDLVVEGVPVVGWFHAGSGGAGEPADDEVVVREPLGGRTRRGSLRW